MDRRTFMLSIAGAAATLALPETAEAAQWVRLGTRRVNGLLDRDRISLAGAGRFDAIRLRVRGNDLLLYDLDIRFRNGRRQDVRVRQLIRQGRQTRAIDLRGDDRAIRTVTFTYGKFPNGRGPTYVELWGRR
jgi:hypothetical protein